jgi:hypothetical protein
LREDAVGRKASALTAASDCRAEEKDRARGPVGLLGVAGHLGVGDEPDHGDDHAR